MSHVRVLAETETPLPPIVVHWPTMRVVDGGHRLLAAKSRGDTTVEVRYFKGSVEDAFVLSVELNRAHGLPLSLSDRTAAARRIVTSYPEWSNRRIAEVAGLSANTVASVRRRSSVQNAQSDVRIGRDGRARPNNGADGRRRAGELMAVNPTASLREVARAAGVSVATAGDVRARLHSGQPVTTRRQRRCAEPDRRRQEMEPGVMVDALRRDPVLRFTESGRRVLRLLEVCTIAEEQWQQLVEGVPPHQKDIIMRLARECSGIWHDFATRLTMSAPVTKYANDH